MSMNKTDHALKLVAQGIQPAQAAREAGVHRSVVTRAMRRAENRRCPCCGQRVLNKKEITA
jgi:transposase